MTPDTLARLFDILLIPILLLTLPFAIGVSLWICSALLNKSNNFGDTESKFDEFGNNDFRLK